MGTFNFLKGISQKGPYRIFILFAPLIKYTMPLCLIKTVFMVIFIGGRDVRY